MGGKRSFVSFYDFIQRLLFCLLMENSFIGLSSLSMKFSSTAKRKKNPLKVKMRIQIFLVFFSHSFMRRIRLRYETTFRRLRREKIFVSDIPNPSKEKETSLSSVNLLPILPKCIMKKVFTFFPGEVRSRSALAHSLIHSLCTKAM